jgi:polynucleotide 5'-hydroxyl-kinase GRC3/NOL9
LSGDAQSDTFGELTVIVVEDGWSDIVEALRQDPAPTRCYVVGSTDAGKTTLCRFLIGELARSAKTAYVDCDTGQSQIGPPTTEGMAFYPARPDEPPKMRFVGSTSPGGHLLQMLTGSKRLVEAAAEQGANATVIDSPGLVFGGVGLEFQFQMIDLLRPMHIVALQKGRELERLLASFASHPAITVHRVPISPAVVTRSAAERRRYREERFAAYFSEAASRTVSLRGLGLHGRVPDLRNPHGVEMRLIALNDNENFTLSLGIIEKADPGRRLLWVHAPPIEPAAIASIQFGSLYLDLDADPGLMESYRPDRRIRSQEG